MRVVVAQVHERINYLWPNVLGFDDGVTEKKKRKKITKKKEGNNLFKQEIQKMKYWNKKQKGVEVKKKANTLKRVLQNKTENWKARRATLRRTEFEQQFEDYTKTRTGLEEKILSDTIKKEECYRVETPRNSCSSQTNETVAVVFKTGK